LRATYAGFTPAESLDARSNRPPRASCDHIYRHARPRSQKHRRLHQRNLPQPDPFQVPTTYHARRPMPRHEADREAIQRRVPDHLQRRSSSHRLARNKSPHEQPAPILPYRRPSRLRPAADMSQQHSHAAAPGSDCANAPARATSLAVSSTPNSEASPSINSDCVKASPASARSASSMRRGDLQLHLDAGQPLGHLRLRNESRLDLLQSLAGAACSCKDTTDSTIIASISANAIFLSIIPISSAMDLSLLGWAAVRSGAFP
jgi:hypothetical protein